MQALPCTCSPTGDRAGHPPRTTNQEEDTVANIYDAPGADMTPAPHAYEGGGSIQDGIAGNYDFGIGAIISEAWEKTKGIKGTVWLALLFYMLALIPVSIAIQFGLRALGLSNDPENGRAAVIVFGFVSQIIQMVIVVPLMTGLLVLSIKLAAGAPAQASDVFSYFSKTLTLLGTALLMYFMIIIGFCLLIIPGIYLSVAYAFAMPLVAEKNLAPWEALETSRKAITHHWFKLFGLYLVVTIIASLSAIPLGIGLIWTIPLMFLTMGLVYCKMFGFGDAGTPNVAE
jgi:uncharacterized membrane protein